MNFYWTQEPTFNSFRETVQVYRNGAWYPEATIYYTNTGRGEFSVPGARYYEQPDGRNRRLTVTTRNGTFEITRRRGGGYSMNTNGYWIDDLGRT